MSVNHVQGHAYSGLGSGRSVRQVDALLFVLFVAADQFDKEVTILELEASVATSTQEPLTLAVGQVIFVHPMAAKPASQWTPLGQIRMVIFPFRIISSLSLGHVIGGQSSARKDSKYLPSVRGELASIGSLVGEDDNMRGREDACL